ncbi:MAG: hypothetical protein ABG776_09400 [Cyanobacteria bacterium J06555_13]
MGLFNSSLTEAPPTTQNPPVDPQIAPSVDPQLRIRILIESAMDQAKFPDSDGELVVRQLAAELNNINAPLSDVRMAVQSLYQGDNTTTISDENRAAAEAYLAYLAKHGFPPTEKNGLQARPAGYSDAQDSPLEKTLRLQHNPHTYGQPPVPSEAALNNIAFYSGNLIAELVSNSAYSALIFGERRSGTSALLRAIAYDQISQANNTILDIWDFHNGEWGGLENVQLEDGSRLVTYQTIAAANDIEAVAKKLLVVANEVKRRERQQRTQSLSLAKGTTLTPYLFLIDGLSEIHGARPGWSADRRSKNPTLSQSASHLRFVLCHGPAVGITCVASARDHSSCLCDATALSETKLFFLGRVSAGRNGGYRAIDKAIEDKHLLPSPHERSRYREAVAAIKQRVYPVVFTPNGIPRLGSLGDFSSYLSVDLLTHYQQSLEGQNR